MGSQPDAAQETEANDRAFRECEVCRRPWEWGPRCRECRKTADDILRELVEDARRRGMVTGEISQADLELLLARRNRGDAVPAAAENVPMTVQDEPPSQASPPSPDTDVKPVEGEESEAPAPPGGEEPEAPRRQEAAGNEDAGRLDRPGQQI